MGDLVWNSNFLATCLVLRWWFLGGGGGSEYFGWAAIKCNGISYKALWYSYDPDLFVLNFVLSAFCIQLATTDPPSVPPWKPCDPRKILRSPRPLACHTWIYNQRQSCWHIDLFNTRLLHFHLFCPFWINLFAPSPRGGVFSMIKIMLETGVSFNS